MEFKTWIVKTKDIPKGWGSMYDPLFKKLATAKDGDFVAINDIKGMNRQSLHTYMKHRGIQKKYTLVSLFDGNRATSVTEVGKIAIVKGKFKWGKHSENIRNIRENLKR